MEHARIITDTLTKFSRMDTFNQWLYENIRPFLGDRVLDAGCGNGNITKFLGDRELVVAVDNFEQVIINIKNKLTNFENLKVVNADIASEQFALSAKKDKIDTILSINSLEHIKEDSMALKNFYEILEPQGRLIILVPALKFLYSTLDKSLGHFRRYNKKEIIQKLLMNNFSIEHISYFNFFGSMGWFLHSKVLKKRKFSSYALQLYEQLMSLFIFIEKVSKIPFGLSLLVIGRKDNREI